MPATSATAATIHAGAKSAAPTIRQDFRFAKIPEIQAVAETTVAANETATNDWFSTAAGMSNPCTDHSADDHTSRCAERPASLSTRVPRGEAAATLAGVSTEAKGESSQTTHD